MHQHRAYRSSYGSPRKRHKTPTAMPLVSDNVNIEKKRKYDEEYDSRKRIWQEKLHGRPATECKTTAGHK